MKAHFETFQKADRIQHLTFDFKLKRTFVFFLISVKPMYRYILILYLTVEQTLKNICYTRQQITKDIMNIENNTPERNLKKALKQRRRIFAEIVDVV